MNLIYMDEVMCRTGLARSTLYFRRKRGEFPEPLRLGLRSIAWRASDVETWLRDRGRQKSKQ